MEKRIRRKKERKQQNENKEKEMGEGKRQVDTADSERTIYALKNIAVVGMSKNEEKPANFVPQYIVELELYHV
ncbi:MAG: hypothetical protein WAM14_26135 [Candidatus Nitrosopolaris sp.]